DSWAGRRGVFDRGALAEYLRAFRNPDVIHATCEDYRAGATVDVEDDAADRGARRIRCPALVLWADDAAEPGWDPIAVWREWAPDVGGRGVPCGPFLPEEAPAETLAVLGPFLAS